MKKKIKLTEQQVRKLLSEVSIDEIDAASTCVNTNPTDNQKEAGNYKMAHVYVKGMGISIENPKGSKRKYHNDDGTDGFNTMKHHYGYFRNTRGNGKDGDAVDVFVGPHPEDFETVYVVDQNNREGDFDESKVMVGFNNEEEAKNAYLSNYSPDWKGFRCITGVSIPVFKKWLYRRHKQRKPFADYVYIIKHKHEPKSEKEQLNEGSRDNLLLPYVELLKQRGINVNTNMLKTYLLRKFVNEALIRNLSLTSNYYLSGVARYYFNGDLTTNKELGVFDDDKTKDTFIPEVCERLNALILILRNSYIDSVGTKWEQTEDFGNLSLGKLLRKYNKAINKELGIEDPKKASAPKLEIDRNDSVGSKGYKFEILYSYEDAQKWNKATEPGAWCITYGDQHFRHYVRDLGIHYVVFYRPDFQNIPRQKSNGWSWRKPQDEYGNSVICVLQSNKDWKPVYITSRWNHGTSYDGTSCEADHAYTTEEFMNVTGVNEADLQRIFKIWQEDKPIKKSASRTEMNAKTKSIERFIKYLQMRLNSGESILNVMPKNEFKYRFIYYNKDKIKRILQAYGQTDDESKKQSLRNSHDKEMLKGIGVVTSKIEDHDVSFMIDNGKIVIPSISYYTIYNYSFDINKCEDNYHTIPNAYVYPTCTMGGSEMYIIYDVKKHQIISIDGVYKFTAVEKLYQNKYPFYAVKKSSSTALLSLYDNIPLKLPNNEYWFETIFTPYYHANKFGPENSPAFQVMYDSAANEPYFYSVKDKTWFKPPEPEEGFTVNIGTSWSSVKNIEGMTVYTMVYTKTEYSATQEDRYEMIMDGVRPVSIGSYTKFRDIGKQSGNYIPFVDTSGKVHLFNLAKNNETKIPVEVTRFGFQQDHSVLITFDDYGYKQYAYTEGNVVFDANSGLFLKNPITGGYWFKIYHNDSYWFTFREPNGQLLRYDSGTGEFSMEPEKQFLRY